MKENRRTVSNCHVFNLKSSYTTQKVSNNVVFFLSNKLVQESNTIREGEVCFTCGKAMYKKENYKCNCTSITTYESFTDTCVGCGCYTTNYMADDDYIIRMCLSCEDAYYQSEYGCCEQCGITLRPGFETDGYSLVKNEYGIVVCDACAAEIIKHRVDSLKCFKRKRC